MDNAMQIINSYNENDALKADLAAANARVAELEADRIVTCVYCGHEYPTGTPTSQNKLLTEHIKVCEKHPMRQLEQQFGEYAKGAWEDKEYWRKKAEQAESQCAAYKKALDIAMSTNQSHETYCKVEAALEEKPQWRSNDK